MDLIQKKNLDYKEISPFDMQMSYVEIRRDSPQNQYDSHVHPECEIYVNLSGDVSFMVENHIYPIMPGNIVITRPYEYHHCIYHSNELHKHFWILFSSNGNERLLERFFDRKEGSGNLLTLPAERFRELVSLCHAMIEKDDSEFDRYYSFFHLIRLLNDAEFTAVQTEGYLQDVETVLDYIEAHYSEPITVKELARLAHVSVNTLERHFEEVLHMPPSVYLKKKRLGIAAALLDRGDSVGEACRKSGFSDDSKFIALFGKTYGITPLQYQKQNSSKQNRSKKKQS